MIWEFRASSTRTVWAQVDADNYEEALDKYKNAEHWKDVADNIYGYY